MSISSVDQLMNYKTEIATKTNNLFLVCFHTRNMPYKLLSFYFSHLPRSTSKIKMAAKSAKSVFVLGYTGETGKALIKELSREQYFARVVLIGRRKIDLPEDVCKDFVSKMAGLIHNRITCVT